MIKRYYLLQGDVEYCFALGLTRPLSDQQEQNVRWLIAQKPGQPVFDESQLSGEVIDIGPRMNFETKWSTNAVSILHAIGVDQAVRFELFRRHAYCVQMVTEPQEQPAWAKFDRMTQQMYPKPLLEFGGERPEPPEVVCWIPVMERGQDALREASKEMGLGWDEQDIEFVFDLFANKMKRNPSNVELFQIGVANSEHCRHWLFKGRLIIDGQEKPQSLLEMVMAPYRAQPGNSVIAFDDNSSAIRGYEVQALARQRPGWPSPFVLIKAFFDILFTAETHNFPTGVEPYEGAATGTGGRKRDGDATGRGSQTQVGTTGYCVGQLLTPDHHLPWEHPEWVYPENLATPLDILCRASDGAINYDNEFGEPGIAGFTRSISLILPNGERWEPLKPVLFSGGMGLIRDEHLKKDEPQPGMLIIQIGGPARKVGMGGGSASSQMQGDNAAKLDWDAVQRGDGEMGRKTHEVIAIFCELGILNPSRAIHDQGAGGPCNVLTELCSPTGGRIEIRLIRLGDKTLPVIVIWGGEYQERYGLLINPEDLDTVKAICGQENCPLEVLGEITGDGRIVVHDSQDDSYPVNLDLQQILVNIPRKTFTDKTVVMPTKPLELPAGLSVSMALRRILLDLAVGSKEHLTSKGDRSVGGLVARQQCCGPRQLPVSDVAVMAISHFDTVGGATAIGEQPLKLLLDPAAGARMSFAEALTNLVWAGISNLSEVRCSVNWMWPAKLPGELAAMCKAMEALTALAKRVRGCLPDGGKDSVSMATKVMMEIVKSLRELVISAYAPCPDIRRVITPDLKRPGRSSLIFIDLAKGKRRLGGSILGHSYGQLGDECPDMEDPELFVRSLVAILAGISRGLILAGHDVSDAGLIITLTEMAFAGNCGLQAVFNTDDPIAELFAEELGLVCECDNDQIDEFCALLDELDVPHRWLGQTTSHKQITIKNGGSIILDEPMEDLLEQWRETSYQLRRIQITPTCADEEKRNTRTLQNPRYYANFPVVPLSPALLLQRIKVAIVREEGSNGYREMAAAFLAAGFEPWDVPMTRLISGEITLDQFRGIAFVGGFSYADVLGSAKGWAAKILLNPDLRRQFNEFYARPDTFAFGVCNGCQLMGWLGWIPFHDPEPDDQVIFTYNDSRKFESRWVSLRILDSPSIMFRGMAGSILGCWAAHGEGKLEVKNSGILTRICTEQLGTLAFVDDHGQATEMYPFNPNASPYGLTGLCSPDGRFNATMEHPERLFQLWQWPWMSEHNARDWPVSPWLQPFINLREWCEEVR